jgi:nucleoside-diphosphate-sugar epimerase
MSQIVLVTGANGFVGRGVVDALSKSSFGVRTAVRHSSRASSLAGHEAVVGDISPDTQWEEALLGVSMVVHLAARVHVMHDTTTDPLTEFRKVNVLGTERLAREAARAGVRRFVYVSSIKVNGESTNAHSGAFAEKNAPNPQDPYGVSKWEAEQALHRVAQETGLEVVIVRPPLVYGPGVGANFLRLLKLVHKGVPLPFGLINNQRSLVYVGNLANAIITCLEHPAATGQTYLVSDGEDVSTPELIRHVAHALGRPARLLAVPPALLRVAGQLTGKSSEVERLLDSLVIDSSKIRRELGWAPPFTMEQGLAETADWYKDAR